MMVFYLNTHYQSFNLFSVYLSFREENQKKKIFKKKWKQKMLFLVLFYVKIG